MENSRTISIPYDRQPHLLLIGQYQRLKGWEGYFILFIL